MKTIGLLGGMSWESSLEYYKIINEETKKRLGGLNSAEILMHSVNFAEIEKLQRNGNWEELTKIMISNAKKLEKGGADFIAICTNTMHKMATNIEENINIPLLHIADATAKKISENNIKKIALIGTKFTMEQDFYKKRITDNYDIEVIIPNYDDIQIIHDIIYNELVIGEIKNNSKKEYLRIISNLKQIGAEGIILGCTEIGLLVKQSDTDIKLFDTTEIHAIACTNFALN